MDQRVHPYNPSSLPANPLSPLVLDRGARVAAAPTHGLVLAATVIVDVVNELSAACRRRKQHPRPVEQP